MLSFLSLHYLPKRNLRSTEEIKCRCWDEGMTIHKEMDKKSIRLAGISLRLLQALIIVPLFAGCITAKTLTPANQTLNKSKIEMSYVVDKSTNTITVSTSDPVVLRTFIMQGFSLSISGNLAYTVKIPSAKDVESKISHHPGEVKATMQGDSEKRPDIRPVIEALNKVDASIYSKTGKKAGKAKNFTVTINPQTGILSYKIYLSNSYSMNMPVTVSLTSIPIAGGDEFNKNQFTNRNESTRRQPFGVGQPQCPNEGQREITIKYPFR